jgi:hypothetical protein
MAAKTVADRGEVVVAGGPLAGARLELDRLPERLEGFVVAPGEREPARGRVDDAHVAGKALVRLVHEAERSLWIEGVAEPLRLEVPLPGGRTVRLARLASDGEHRRARLRRARVPARGRVAEEDDRPRRCVERHAVELERRATREHDIDLLVPEALLRVALDDVVADALSGVGVHAERLDPECSADRPPTHPAGDRDRRDVRDAECAPPLLHALDATGTPSPLPV